MEPFVRSEDRPGRPVLFHIEDWMHRFPGVTAGITSRIGGVSAEPFDSLNCGLHVNDAPEAVIMNRVKLAEAVGMPLNVWTYGEQVHGCKVAVVTRAEAGRGTLERGNALQDTDAFITDTPGVCIGALYADCVPLYFYDPVRHAAGVAHAGWKGTAAEIALETVRAMGQAFGTKPDDLYAAIGPSIGVCCYEVDDSVIGRIRGVLSGPGAPSAHAEADGIYRKKDNGRYMLNLQQANRQIMIKAGIMPSRIEITCWCTSCRTDLFFSHRKERGSTGRMSAWIGLLPLRDGNGRNDAL